MKNFIKPVKYGKLISKSNKKYIYEPDSSDKIIAPYDGIINDIDTNKCKGFIQIQHYINGNIFYSEICGINNFDIFVSNGMRVNQGDDLSKCGGENIEYEIKDTYKDKVAISVFFNLSHQEEEKPKEKYKEEKPKEKPKEKYNKYEKSDYELNNNKNEKLDFSKKIGPLPDLFTAALLTPIHFANKALSHSSKKETKEDEEEIMEELNRIKKLIK